MKRREFLKTVAAVTEGLMVGAVTGTTANERVRRETNGELFTYGKNSFNAASMSGG